ncbi:MAG: hypothetical protein IJL66_04305 [Lachnospiraceae bacterium]|nr:hypothetical protein [Lachnospiraceae bacterium]
MEMFSVSAAGILLLLFIVLMIVGAVRLRRGRKRAVYSIWIGLTGALFAGMYFFTWLWIYYRG